MNNVTFKDPYLTPQWEKWKDSKDAVMLDIDTDELIARVTADLAYVSQMDVKEYTLYQKWVEIHEKYPTKIVSGLFGDELEMVYPEQRKEIWDVKSKIWIPESPEDYEKLEPVLEYTDDSVAVDNEIMGAVTKRRDSRLPETWNTARTFISTMKNNANIGRNMNYIVKDNVTGKFLGVICISSDFLDLTPRDKVIGWQRVPKTGTKQIKGMINYTAIGSTIVPFQPLGFNYVGGKLLALLCLSDEVQNRWYSNYGDRLVGLTTTSLYGNTKAGGLSQYDNLDHWQPMGFSIGSVSFDVSRETRKLMCEWLKKHYTKQYFEWWVAKKPSGGPYMRDHKNRSQIFMYQKMGIPKNLIRCAHQRGIYFAPFYDNTYEFLRQEITEKDLVKSFDTSYEALVNIWKTKHAKGRIKQLMKKNNVSYETLFYDDLIYLSWEETKAKYLQQVGR